MIKFLLKEDHNKVNYFKPKLFGTIGMLLSFSSIIQAQESTNISNQTIKETIKSNTPQELSVNITYLQASFKKSKKNLKTKPIIIANTPWEDPPPWIG